MFEVPNAKRVRREELYGESSDEDDRHHDEAEDAETRAQLARLLGLDVSIGPDVAATAPPVENDAEAPAAEEEFEFRLFSAPAGDAPAPKVVIVADEDAAMADGNAGSLVADRPLAYYVIGEPTGERKHAFEFAAVSGEDVLKGAGRRNWGLEVPWRVRRVVLSAKQLRALKDHGWGPTEGLVPHNSLAVGGEPVGDSDEKKKRRPGKKRRIALRTKDKAKKDKAAAAEKSKISKEEHLREKKKRLNREKKLKRRQKAKEQKLAGKETNEAGDDDESSGSDGE